MKNNFFSAMDPTIDRQFCSIVIRIQKKKCNGISNSSSLMPIEMSSISMRMFKYFNFKKPRWQ